MCLMSAILLAKPLMPGTMFWNLQQYICIFAIVKYRSYFGGMSDCVPKDDFSTTEVYICISLDRNPFPVSNIGIISFDDIQYYVY